MIYERARELVEVASATGRREANAVHSKGRGFMIEAWDVGAYRKVREIWEQAAIQAGDDKFKRELIHAKAGPKASSWEQILVQSKVRRFNHSQFELLL